MTMSVNMQNYKKKLNNKNLHFSTYIKNQSEFRIPMVSKGNIKIEFVCTLIKCGQCPDLKFDLINTAACTLYKEIMLTPPTISITQVGRCCFFKPLLKKSPIGVMKKSNAPNCS